MGLCQGNERKAKKSTKKKERTGNFDANELKNDLILEINKGIFINEIINELRKEDSNIKSTINTKVESKIDIVEHPKEIIKEISLKNEGKINLIEVKKEDSNNRSC